MGFTTALEAVLKHEGGYVDDPDDPGGATNMGITFQTLRDWRGTLINKDDVRGLTKTEAAAIYQAKYWDAVKCNHMPPAVGFIVFDAAVNHGPRRAARFLQEALKVKVDGVIGPITLGAIHNFALADLIDEFCAIRADLYETINEKFERGWFRRLMHMHRLALSLI